MTDTVDAYREQTLRSRQDAEGFWLDVASRLEWHSPPSRALETDGTEWSWFPDGELNLSANALDRHVRDGRGEQTALIFDSAMTETTRSFTYAELLESTARFAGVLRAQGVERGDRVLLYMPMIPEAVVAMLACARLGAIHAVVFGGFAAGELAGRLADSGARVVVTASGGREPGRLVDYLPILDEALGLAGVSTGTVVVKAREGFPTTLSDLPERDGIRWLDWNEQIASAEPAAPVPVRATDPLYVLHTSGTTGQPKGITRDTGGYAAALVWSMENIYGISPGDVMWTASDVGWVVGHSYIVYGPLLAGATTVLYEGKPVGTPDAGAFWRVVADHSVDVLFTAPTAIRAIHRADPELELLDRQDVSSLRAIFLAGERLDPETFHWLGRHFHIPIIDHWWQTETGWPITANPLGLGLLPTKAGSSTVPMVGFDIAILDGKGRELPPGQDGNIALRLPLPPGVSNRIWGDPDRFRAAYLSAFPGYYATGDLGRVDEDGYVFVMGRTDDVINIAGHRLSTGALEEVLAFHEHVAECAVIGAHDQLKGQRAIGFVVLTAGHTETSALARELVELVRRHIGPVAAFRDVIVVERLPKTRSGKILRKTLRQIVDGESYKVPPTIEDPSVLDAVTQAIAAHRVETGAVGTR